MTDNRTTELLPCPICGSEPEYQAFNVSDNCHGRIICACGLEIRQGRGETRDDITIIWNTRTPEQAIAATLGSGTLTAEQVMAIVGKHQPDYCSDTHVCFDWQAIADELNARAERTCEFAVKDNMNESEGMGDVWIECSACHCQFDYYADDWLMKMSYCPNCGRRIEA
jgi:hypothetical protein